VRRRAAAARERLVLATLSLLVLTGAADEKEEREARDPSLTEADELAHLESVVSPGARAREAFRLRIGYESLPASDFGSAEVSLHRPELRARVTLPLSKRAVLRVVGDAQASFYDFSGSHDLLGPERTGEPFDDLYEARLALQGAYRLRTRRTLFGNDHDVWSLLAEVFARSRWEPGAFGSGLTEGATLALAFEIEDRLRLAAGVRVETEIDGGGVQVSPFGSFRWYVNERWTLRSSGAGLRLEYGVNEEFELFGGARFQSRSHRLSRKPLVPSALTVSDRQVPVELGCEWKPGRHVRLQASAGLVAYRQLEVFDRSGDRVGSMTARPGAFLAVRVELRP
jgi:hypothetical protein